MAQPAKITPSVYDTHTVEYRGYVIRTKRDFGDSFHLIDGMPCNFGYIFTKGPALATPGATWFQTVAEAKEAINVLEIYGERDFWEGWKARKAAIQRANQTAIRNAELARLLSKSIISIRQEAQNCRDRTPQTGLLRQAAKELDGHADECEAALAGAVEQGEGA